METPKKINIRFFKIVKKKFKIFICLTRNRKISKQRKTMENVKMNKWQGKPLVRFF